jgi:hypothetical protein
MDELRLGRRPTGPVSGGERAGVAGSRDDPGLELGDQGGSEDLAGTLDEEGGLVTD